MSQTKRERKKLQKKVARRKAYVKNRNRLQGRKKKAVQIKDSKVIDGAEFYRKLKEQEAKTKKPAEKRQDSLFTKLLSKFTRGRQK